MYVCRVGRLAKANEEGKRPREKCPKHFNIEESPLVGENDGVAPGRTHELAGENKGDEGREKGQADPWALVGGIRDEIERAGSVMVDQRTEDESCEERRIERKEFNAKTQSSS